MPRRGPPFGQTVRVALDASDLADAPPPLARWPSNFSVFNAALLPLAGAEGLSWLLHFRVSNMHFCDGGTWRTRMQEQTHLRSYIGSALLDSSWRPRGTPAPAVLRAASELFRTEGTDCERAYWMPSQRGEPLGTFSGPEDPRTSAREVLTPLHHTAPSHRCSHRSITPLHQTPLLAAQLRTCYRL
jgi:hypothetical protein